VRTCAGNNRGACRVGRWARLDLLPPEPSSAPSLPRLRVPARAGAFFVKSLTACGFVNFVNLTFQKRTLGGDAYRDPSH
jgi:hypothetical protein